MSEFELKLKQAMEANILKGLQNTLRIPFGSRMRIPDDLIDSCWDLVDFEKVKKELAANLEKELADRLVNMMAKEIATDVKTILSLPERREVVRSVVRDNIKKLTGGKIW